MIPLHTAQIVGSSVNAPSSLTTFAMSKSRSELCIRKANQELFKCRGLKVELAKLDVVARLAQMPIFNNDGKIDKKALVLGPLEEAVQQVSLSSQQRRLQALELWIAPLELTPFPDLHVPDNVISKMHAATSESQRKKEKKMVKDRAKAHKDWVKDSRETQQDYEKEMKKIEKETLKAQRKHAKDERELDKELKKLEKERQKCEKEYRKDMGKVEKDRRKDDEEEKGVRKVLWMLIRPLDDVSVENMLTNRT
ncbi:hypothetical protein EDB81DRAFT_388449 [Dactylonectria macrodidyma]|uniref:Uncharacterized protein n=1 Tax=Dactylonectria macrodidyma TaxID=307937 RepID=A0A9P9F7Y7_9HYPO|nr:hypothetical protein EDB81DRAFT_388449 [Dactylonectria macrodidyma]